jgi:hypothetical protein
MKLDGHPFPQNMIGFPVNMVTAEEEGKVKVLTSARAKQGGAVDPARQEHMPFTEKAMWRPKDKPEGSGRSAPTCMVYFLPNEFMAPANQVVQEETSLNINEDEQLGGLMAQLVLAKQATFDKPTKNRHMRPLYLKGYVNGKPLTKMFVDGGAAVNVMPYTTFRKLGMGHRRLDANKHNFE